MPRHRSPPRPLAAAPSTTLALVLALGLVGCGPGAGPVPWPTAAAASDGIDLVQTGFSSTPDHFILGQQATIHVQVSNHGRLPAGPFDVEFAVTPHGTRTAWPRQHVAGLAAGAHATVDFQVQVSSPEDVPIEIVIDAGDAVSESDESNNVQHFVVSVTVPG